MIAVVDIVEEDMATFAVSFDVVTDCGVLPDAAKPFQLIPQVVPAPKEMRARATISVCETGSLPANASSRPSSAADSVTLKSLQFNRLRDAIQMFPRKILPANARITPAILKRPETYEFGSMSYRKYAMVDGGGWFPHERIDDLEAYVATLVLLKRGRSSGEPQIPAQAQRTDATTGQ
jgi:hypothetical protein